MEKQQEPASMKTSMLKNKLKAIGPGAIVTASFIGPGTVTTATRAGASFGFALLWAVIFSIIATIVLQEMCARLGIITQKGLGAAIREHFTHPLLKYASMFLVLVAILVGSSAYMAGDLLGTSMGISTLTGISPNVLAPLFGIVILALGLSGSYKLVEKLMIVLVVIMSITFVTTMVVAKPPLGALFQGAFIPTVPDQSIIMIIALIGTTVVPYNLFLHSENVIERWNKPAHLADSRWDIVISISVGGLITAAILITSATMMQGMEVKNVSDLSVQLEPLLGSWALVFTSIGLFAAGFTSALASPLGAAITASSILKWSGGMRDKRFKIVFSAVILFGVVSSSLGFEPLDVLLFAQALNGILLPFVSIMLLIIMNNKNRLGNYVNSLKMNVVGGIVVALCTGLGLYSFVDAVRAFFG
ncbi:Nramp family divalent metal transporter [Shouchella clausii]|uniref:Nramp family divalent metal transporter n=1 Tax=Shouchella clausii TaxID=79880 RepID=UPI000D1F07DC|nr:Nramp family divalent metal transporter [Shouchella clausii]MCY1105039.1 Nramp family divalent metal transporter [Shouchella clausii]MED4157465.1 Nramp family divalent metal transporter [Shouchella clausii]MED4177682.1 Nramp family divalent metal transporter [Shouchella clausii]PTL23187.1 manganese transporter [Shouchella clausii]